MWPCRKRFIPYEHRQIRKIFKIRSLFPAFRENFSFYVKLFPQIRQQISQRSLRYVHIVGKYVGKHDDNIHSIKGKSQVKKENSPEYFLNCRWVFS